MNTQRVDMLSKFFNNIVIPIFLVLALVTAVELFFTYLIVFFVIIFVVVFVIALIAFIFGMIPIDVTHADGTKKQYYIGDVIRLCRSK